MINNETELATTQRRIEKMQLQIAHLRSTEDNQQNHQASVSGYISEVDRMQLEIREFLPCLPELAA